MKIILTTLTFFILLQTSQVNAGLIVGFKNWSFSQSFQSWNTLSTRYDVNGRANCSSPSCRLTYWASSDELDEMLMIAIRNELFDGGPLFADFVGPPSLCESSSISCVWHGWLREESLLDPVLALSADIAGFCIPGDSCQASFTRNGANLSYQPKTFADEGGSGGVAITGHWTYVKVNTPSVTSLVMLCLFAMVFVRKTTNGKLISTFLRYKRQS
jgi:hypothetical protein